MQEAGFIIKYLLANFISKSCKGRVHGVESTDRSGQCQNVGFSQSQTVSWELSADISDPGTLWGTSTLEEGKPPP